MHPLDGEIYAQIINLSCAYEVYFHGSSEVPDIARQRYSFTAADYTTVELLALEIITSDNAKEYVLYAKFFSKHINIYKYMYVILITNFGIKFRLTMLFKLPSIFNIASFYLLYLFAQSVFIDSVFIWF